MKKAVFTVLLLMFIGSLSAQNNNQNDQGKRLARKIAKNIKDSLQLTGNQMNQLYIINLSIHNKKKQARTLYANRDSVGNAIQRIEKTRDSLYRQVIPANKFDLYKSKKRQLINNNYTNNSH